MIRDPTIHVLAGVNGSGKSSIGGAQFTANGVAYYNPDEVARRLCEIHPSMTQGIANSHAWNLGRDLLEAAIEKKETFAFETTLGGKTITDLLLPAHRKGLRVKVWYVGLDSVELNIARVQERVRKGGHPIPEENIRQRWDYSRRNLIRLLPSLHSLRLFDNSQEADPREGHQPRPVLLLDVKAGRIIGPQDLSRAPDWAKPIVSAALDTYDNT